jgi:hypothetical protein
MKTDPVSETLDSFEYRTMGKTQKPSNSECYMYNIELFRIYSAPTLFGNRIKMQVPSAGKGLNFYYQSINRNKTDILPCCYYLNSGYLHQASRDRAIRYEVSGCNTLAQAHSSATRGN